MNKIVNPARIEVEIDCANVHMTKLEAHCLREDIENIIKKNNMKVVDYKDYY